MYQPPHFRETRLDVLHDLIRAHPLGLLASNGADGPVADLVPFLIDPAASALGTLRAHVARANPHWKLIAENPGATALVVFQGANSYVTPSWYETKRQTGKVVPTWNYAVVQARGHVRIHDGSGWLAGQVEELTLTHEAARSDSWHVADAPDAYIAAQLRGIVGLEIEIAAIDGKWKVSQNRPEADRAGVARGLDSEASPDAADMAELVRCWGGVGSG